jgi:hypothetical protein
MSIVHSRKSFGLASHQSNQLVPAEFLSDIVSGQQLGAPLTQPVHALPPERTAGAGESYRPQKIAISVHPAVPGTPLKSQPEERRKGSRPIRLTDQEVLDRIQKFRSALMGAALLKAAAE